MGTLEPGSTAQAALDAAIDAFVSIAVINHRGHRLGQPLIEFGLGTLAEE